MLTKSKQEITTAAISNFASGMSCSQSVLLAFAEATKLDDRTAALIASGFGGGMGHTKGRCGALTAAFMVMGLTGGFAFNASAESKSEFYKKIRALNQKQMNKFGCVNCNELLTNYPDGEPDPQAPAKRRICVDFVRAVVEDLYDELAGASQEFLRS